MPEAVATQESAVGAPHRQAQAPPPVRAGFPRRDPRRSPLTEELKRRRVFRALVGYVGMTGAGIGLLALAATLPRGVGSATQLPRSSRQWICAPSPSIGCTDSQRSHSPVCNSTASWWVPAGINSVGCCKSAWSAKMGMP
jgi:hypothetical protein